MLNNISFPHNNSENFSEGPYPEQESLGGQSLGSLPDFLQYAHRGESYLPEEYYTELLEPYRWRGGSDLAALRAFLSHCAINGKTLEIGVANGRSTHELVSMGLSDIVLVDASKLILNSCSRKFGPALAYVPADGLDFLSRCKQQYSTIVCLWSLSHAIHNALHTGGIEAGSMYVSQVLDRTLREVLPSQGRMFIIHFDATTDQQRLVCACKALKYEAYREFDPTNGQQSLSLRLLTEAILRNQDVVDARIEQVKGYPVVYRNLPHAMETFLNFHLEGVFNHDKQHLPEVLRILERGLQQYQQSDGTIVMGVGAYILEIERNDSQTIRLGEASLPSLSPNRYVDFFDPKGQHSILCNFSPHPIFTDGKMYKTVEHYYQASKFSGCPKIQEKIIAASSPEEAKRLSRVHVNHLRQDWESVKISIMRKAVKAKCDQHPEVKEYVKTSTGTFREVNDVDNFWGTYFDGSGKNWMGKILAEIRKEEK